MASYTAYTPPTNLPSCMVGAPTITTLTSAQSQSLTPTTWTTISDGTTSLTGTRTPASRGNTLDIFVTLSGIIQTQSYIRFIQDGNPVQVGNAAGSRVQCLNSTFFGNIGSASIISKTFIISIPAGTTNATTISMQIYATASTSLLVNRSQTDTNSSSFPRCISQMTIFEFSN